MTENLSSSISASLQSGNATLSQFLQNGENVKTIEEMAVDLAKCFQAGNKVLSCGNGGSACEASHFAEELSGRYRKHRKALPALALTEPGYLTCVGNDYGFDHVFARGVEAFGKPGDILLALSTSGDSPNVIQAVETAKHLGMHTFLLLGKDGGKLKGAGTRELLVAGTTTDRIQEIHMICIHVLIECLERILFPENY